MRGHQSASAKDNNFHNQPGAAVDVDPVPSRCHAAASLCGLIKGFQVWFATFSARIPEFRIPAS